MTAKVLVQMIIDREPALMALDLDGVTDFNKVKDIMTQHTLTVLAGKVDRPKYYWNSLCFDLINYINDNQASTIQDKFADI